MLPALLLLLVGATPLNGPINKPVISLPPNVSFTGEDYDYKVIWVHDAPFVLVGQYYNDQLLGGFVMYTPYNLKRGQNVYVKQDIRFVHVGVVVYMKRLVHVLVPIHKDDVMQAEEIKEQIVPEMRQYYGSI